MSTCKDCCFFNSLESTVFGYCVRKEGKTDIDGEPCPDFLDEDFKNKNFTDKQIADGITMCLTGVCDYCEYQDDSIKCTEFENTARKWLEEKGGGKLFVDRLNAEHELPCTTETTDDQSFKADAGKPELCLIPLKALIPVARVREYGIKKYGSKEGWREVSIERYQNAAFRHWLKYLNDPHGVDEESGLPHLWHCLTNLMFLTELEDLQDGGTNIN